jgi:outer membrane protein assembly factor BamB
MTIKVQCPCGAKYSFEVEPVDGRMPFAVTCPVCNADGTELANQLIAQQPVAPKLRVHVAAEAAEAPVTPRTFPQAPKVSSVERLREERKQWRLIGTIAGVVTLIILALLGAWGWFLIVGSKPQLEYSVKIPGPDYNWRSQFLDARTILVVNPVKATAHDVVNSRDLWSTALADNAAGPPEGPPPQLFVDNDGIWICLGDRVLRLDRATGQIKKTIPVTGQFVSFTPAGSNILVVSAKGPTAREAMQINLATGDTTTRDIVIPRSEKHQMPNELPPNVQPTAAVLLSQALDEQKFNKPLDAMSSEFFSTGQNMVELRVKLLEPKVTYVQAIKSRGPSHLDGNTTASTSVGDVEEEVFNDIKRSQTGGVKTIDESRYEVKLRRWTDAMPVEWTGQVLGLPSFFPLQTVDLLVAGPWLAVFDKNNQKLFEAKLSYPIGDQFSPKFWDRHSAPALESKGSLYFFDKGVLTAFSLPSGEVRWRATTVGTTKVQQDASGALYVDTTTAAPEDIQYSEQIKFQNAAPLLMKIDAASGKILWQAASLGQDCYLSGKYLYTSSVNKGGIAMANGLAEALNAPREEGPIYFHVYRLDPADGKQMWDFYRQERPMELSFDQTRFLIRFSDRVLVYKYLVF